MTDPLASFPSRVEFPVAWGDMDAFGHVNNTVYFRYFESGRLDYFAAVGITDYMDRHGQGPILAHTECRFRIPLRWPDRVTIGTRVESIGEDRFTMAYRVIGHASGGVAAEGTGRIVWFDYGGEGGKRPLPAEIVTNIRAFDGGAEAA